jgi:hypothetical protein
MGDTPFDSITQRCQTAKCLADKLTTHRDYRNYNVYISFFIHRFIQLVQMQMQEKYQHSVSFNHYIQTWYVLLCPRPGTPNKWQYVVRKTGSGITTSNKDGIGLYHVEFIPQSERPLEYGNVVLLVQNDKAMLIPFDVSTEHLSADIPWHEITGKLAPYNMQPSNVHNPMLSLLWLHATLHLGGDVMETMRGQYNELNGMAMYELQMADILVPTGNINEILTRYENERVVRIQSHPTALAKTVR